MEINSGSAVNELALSVIAGAYLLVFTIEMILWNRMEKILTKMDRHFKVIEGRFEVLDRVGSEVTDEPFNSHAVASGKQRHPTTIILREMFSKG